MESPRSKEVKEAYEKHHEWIESLHGVNGCSYGIDDQDRDVIRVITDPAHHDELSKVIRQKVGNMAHFIPATPEAFE